MADGDIVVDVAQRLDDLHLRLRAVESSEYPGGYAYRFQCYHPADGTLLRYDNAHDSDVGPHHRHWGDDPDEVEGIAFTTLAAHLARFEQEVSEIHARRADD